MSDLQDELQSAVDTILVAPPSVCAASVAALDPQMRSEFLLLKGHVRTTLVAALARAVIEGGGQSKERLALGELLGLLGDPRLQFPSDSAYWVKLTTPHAESFSMGRNMVTNAEFRAFVSSGAYHVDTCWSAEGRAWRDATDKAWPVLAGGDDVGEFVIANQPVVGLSYYEASAYARWVRARLPTWAERQWASRGANKRPYPWGSPFGSGKANTREECLRRPCAVGLYRGDVTPEGIYDLAGNAGEWTSERVGDEVLLHPGSWEQPSLASWAKASTTAEPGDRWPALGLRLARDA